MVFAILALCLGLGLIAAGCGASGGLTPIESGRSEDLLAESTVSHLNKCAKQWAGDLKKRSYKVRYNVTVNRHGGVRGVDRAGTGLDVDPMEKCMVGALRNMTVPSFVYERAEEELATQRIPTHARGLFGQAVAEPILIILTPVVIEAAPVVIIVVIGIVVTAAIASSTSKRMSKECLEEWAKALADCEEMISSPNPPRGVTGSYWNPRDCARGLVSEDCKGNKVDHGNQGRPGRRY
ncbi:MAG: hypothetical protein HUU21_39625 [Polyangiaceae bacterium]|nr:hypothetical protein [Polyangiaceae bacterium]